MRAASRLKSPLSFWCADLTLERQIHTPKRFATMRSRQLAADHLGAGAGDVGLAGLLVEQLAEGRVVRERLARGLHLADRVVEGDPSDLAVRPGLRCAERGRPAGDGLGPLRDLDADLDARDERPRRQDGPDDGRVLGRGDAVAVGVDVADEPVHRVGTGAEAGALLDQLEVAAVSEQLLVGRGERLEVLDEGGPGEPAEVRRHDGGPERDGCLGDGVHLLGDLDRPRHRFGRVARSELRGTGEEIWHGGSPLSRPATPACPHQTPSPLQQRLTWRRYGALTDERTWRWARP